MVKLVLPCGEVCCEKFFCNDSFVSNRIRRGAVPCLCFEKYSHPSERSHSSDFRHQKWRGHVHVIARVACGCGGNVVWKLRALCHVSLCAWLQQFAGAFDVRTVFTGPYERAIAETVQGSGGTEVPGWSGMKSFHVLEVPLKSELQGFEGTVCLEVQEVPTRSVCGAFFSR